MNDQELRALVRDAVARHLGARRRPAAARRLSPPLDAGVTPCTCRTSPEPRDVPHARQRRRRLRDRAVGAVQPLRLLQEPRALTPTRRRDDTDRRSVLSHRSSRLGRAIRGMDEPAVEKISEDTREDPFRC